tara:strand:+ start:240 stop:530 length:291 start_codon:yes stop_codon:yes gene_type:complete
MKLKILAEAAAEFYQTPDLRSRIKPDRVQTKKARHVCQYLACEAGYHRSIVGRFWGMDRTSIYYGCQMVANRIDTDPAEKLELKRFMEVVRERFNA